MANLLTLRNSTVMILGATGFLIGYRLILWDAFINQCSKSFIENTPQFVVWNCLVGLQVALWFVLARSLWIALLDLRQNFKGNEKEILLSILILALLFFGLPYIISFRTHSPLEGHSYKIGILTLMAFCLIEAPACVGMWLVHVGLRRISFKERQPNSSEIVHFLDLQNRLQSFLVIAGTGIGAATLVAGALRNALIAWAKSADTLPSDCTKIAKAINFPPDVVLLYGLYLSALLALAYIPIFVALQAKGREICDSTYPNSPSNSGSSDSWVSWYSDRKKLEELLKIPTNIMDSLKTSVAILAPLTGSAVSLLLGTK